MWLTIFKGRTGLNVAQAIQKALWPQSNVRSGIDGQWQADLADMQAIARQNKGVRYLLTVIYVFSKFAWVAPVKSKDAATVTKVFQQILASGAARHPRRLQTDKGKKFFNSTFVGLMKSHNIQHFASERTRRRRWSSASTVPLKRAYGRTCLTAEQCAGLTWYNSSWTPTTPLGTGRLG